MHESGVRLWFPALIVVLGGCYESYDRFGPLPSGDAGPPPTPPQCIEPAPLLPPPAMGFSEVTDTTAGRADLLTGSCAARGAPERVYRIALPTRTTLVVETMRPRDDEGFDTVLVLLDEDCLELACDDDGGDGFFSRVERTLDAGVYHIAVDGFEGEAGTYLLRMFAR